MASHWTPRAPTGQRRNPGIYSASRPKRGALESVEESSTSRQPQTERSLSSLVSSFVSDIISTDRSNGHHIERSFRPANEPDRPLLSPKSGYASKHSQSSANFGFRYNAESGRFPSTSTSPMESSFYSTPYGTHYPRTTGSLRDDQGTGQHSLKDPRFEYLDVTTRSPMYPHPAGGTEDVPMYTTLSQDFKALQCSDSESNKESPSTVAPDSQTDSHGNSSDSDAPPIRRGFTSEDSPDGSSDSDVPASTDSASPDVASIEPPSSDIDLTSSDEEKCKAPCNPARVFSSPDRQPLHPLMVIGWTGSLPLEEPEAESPRSAKLSPTCDTPRQPDVQNARHRTLSAKRLSKALDTELRDLEDEMSSLTKDLIAIKRTIPSRTSEGNLVFSSTEC
eukprot:gnl/MRDRNA2_/MRDRNA2_107223_c0_seq1.p1 gnl/MRDRNA2_/MRDRNA2_107223_c0~~gnl/MRDRNA2_/MRDRNA2_107223_c0_seq1.p1  ORF type:complete len:435 (+),score=41.53 gnl/MRDRNA2_/MRDRNA2_107223_c0_seq1:130-1305(+)